MVENHKRYKAVVSYYWP